MKVTQKSKLALVSLVHMARNTTQRLRVQDLAEKQTFSTHFLEQIFRNLRMAGIVRSVRGPGGGYELARPLNKISVTDVLAALGESTSAWGEKISETPEAMLVSGYLSSAEEKVQKDFANTTLEQILGVAAVIDNVVQFPTPGKLTEVA